MPIIHVKTKQVIASNCWEAKSIISRARGMLLRKFSSDLDAMIFRKNNSIHMWFIEFPIDVVYISDGKVVKLVERLKPWSLSACKIAQDVIELPIGTISKFDLCLDDKLAVIADTVI
ncbi:MAG: DUF192 domain-containing protein [Lentisphaeria bacterium]|nr:DUF192 domain-containing protein [Lentisphaeria bacterium]